MRLSQTLILLAILGALPAARAQQYERGPARSPHGSLKISCTNCHTSTSWSPLRAGLEFNHNTETSFALRGAHESVSCRLCHTSLVFENTGSNCSNCHADIHRRQFGGACESCHTPLGWRASVQSIRAHQNRFPLLGAHTAAPCESCHQGAATAGFTGRSTECASCHLKDFQEARPLNHVAANLPLTCELCHGMDNFTRARFDHARFTGFRLDGVHVKAECLACHTGGSFNTASQECFTCHSTDFAATRTVDHVKAGFPNTCLTCHNTSAWTGGRFDHAAMTQSPLTGAHQQTACASCHANSVYAGTRQDCYGCHAGTYAATRNPDHARSSFPTNCADCHTTAGWPGARFDHGLARFQLTGAHVQASCTQCHAGGQYTGTNSLCAGCHLADFNRAANPNHVTAGFTQECAACHTTARWTGVSFDHASKTRFALTGAHVQVNCNQCHVGDRFAGLGSQCAECHLGDYQKAANPNHAAAGFPQDCLTCHTTAQWAGAAFDHNSRTRFALTGAHVQPACIQCHEGGRFAGTPTDCVGCHVGTFQRTTNPNHAAAGFPQNCVACHTTSAWTGGAFDHARTRFTLAGAHTQVACSQCHVGDRFAGTATDCVGCHLAAFQRTTNPNHVSAGFPQDCTTCHTTARWTGAVFDHGRTKFMLTGAHTQVVCGQCHVGGKFAGTPTDCVGCHLGTFQQTKNPDHVAAGFSQQCVACHTTARWAGAAFDHTTGTRFTLTGAHTQVACSQCHVGGRYAGTPTDCVGCHLATFQRTTNPNHVSAGFPQTCTTCHTTTRWTGATFNHTTGTRFTLTGAHTQVACSQCHVGGRYAGTPTDCVGCHLATFQRTTSPNHVSAGFPQTCASCHTTTRWTGATFDHSARTRFTLTGAHTQVACSQCHVGGQYAGTPTDCVGCHLATFQRTANPNHVSAGFPQTCTTCHTTTRWTGATFNHTTGTRFTLTGAHIQVACSQCHVGGRYAGTPTECAGCHLATFQRTTNPNHVSAGFPQTCASCHTTTRWTGATFDHSARTRFALTGAHVQVACTQCHVGGRYAGTPTDCVGCHLTTFQRTTSPNHVTAGFPQTCTTCHTTAAWRPSSFSHSSTRFALTGAHTQVTCAQCHVGGRYAGTPTQCSGCHLARFQQTTNPNHVSAGFPQDCSLCHSTTRWTGATFNHSATRFPLVGRHTSLTCSACHAAGVYTGLASTCASCHLAAYQRTTNPSHTAAGFPQQCEVCHTPSGWTPSSFNHATTRFALTGRHTAVACANCHVGGRYAGTPTNCYSCHATQYNTVTSPNHRAAGFPTTCQTCHTTSGWSGATFNHTWFPITSGAHRNRTCVECHTNPSNYQVFTCTTCHTKSSTDSHHQGRTGYVYNSTNCYSCHPSGRAG